MASINNYLVYNFKAGLYQRQERILFRRLKQKKHDGQVDLEKIKIEHLLLPFTFLILGLIISMITFLIENISQISV